MSNLFEIQPIPESFSAPVEVDDNVIADLPPGARVVSAFGHGASFWTRTARVEVEFPDKSSKAYFLKVAAEDNGHDMVHGEFESMKAIYTIMPTFVPKPISWGTFKSNANLHYFICDFHEMDHELPDMNKFTAMVAEMHRKSTSPNGKYGFHVTTHNGNLPQDNRWTDTWEEFYAQAMRGMLELEVQSQGPRTEEMEALLKPLFEKVIPRLLRPLETGENSIKPSLVHGDLWHGNTSNDLDTNEPITFDASAFWGHNEYDVRTMRPARYKFGRKWLKAYQDCYPPSRPEEDHDSRNALYALRSYLHDSALYSSNSRFRQNFVEEVKRLVEMYPEGYEAFTKG